MVAVLDNPALGHRVGVPVDYDAAGGGGACAQAGDIGANGCGEVDGIAPVAYKVVGGAAERANGGVVSGVGCEAADSEGVGVDSVNAVGSAAVPLQC